MASLKLTIGNDELVDVIEFDWVGRHCTKIYVNGELIWSANTGRTTTGLMVGDIIAEKDTVSLCFHMVSKKMRDKIADIIPDITRPFKRVSMSLDNEVLFDFTGYRSTIQQDGLGAVNGEYYYRDISFEIIEQ